MISSILRWTAIFVGCFVVQTTVVPAISFFGVKPDLVVIAVFFLAIKVGVIPAVYIGFFVGLAQDLYSPSILGQNALALTMASFFAGLFNEKIMRIDPVFQAVLLILTFLLGDTVIIIVQVLKNEGGMGILISELFTATLPRALYSLVFAVVPYLWDNFFQTAAKR